jgi:hypothetical protein
MTPVLLGETCPYPDKKLQRSVNGHCALVLQGFHPFDTDQAIAFVEADQADTLSVPALQ